MAQAPLKEEGRPSVCAIVPVQNEAAAIRNVLRQLHRSGVQEAVIVANGCVDATPHVADQLAKELFRSYKVVQVFESLGPDVPKAVGTFAALRSFTGPQWFVYVDGDWKGSFGPMLEAYLKVQTASGEEVQWIGVEDNQHAVGYRTETEDDITHSLWQSVLESRCPQLQNVAPSRGPLLIHRRAFSEVSPFWLHHPGCWFALCALRQRADFQLSVNHGWDGRLVGNPTRSREHALKMAETILGDTVEGCRLLMGQKPSRNWRGRALNGYHSARRMDILQKWQTQF